MDERIEGRNMSRRMNADFWKCGQVSEHLIDDIHDRDRQNEIRSEIHQTTVDNSNQILPHSNSEYKVKKYSRTLSETHVSHRPVANSAKLKRVLSASEIRTRLAGCPKGLLIATEPPKSGDSYRRRSNTDVRTMMKKNTDSLLSKQQLSESVYQEDQDLEEDEKETLFLELETVKREREELQKENERLQEELENRNKVIDHLVDFMKSSLPGKTPQMDDLGETLTNNINRPQPYEKF